jgi:hypothetical protein
MAAQAAKRYGTLKQASEYGLNYAAISQKGCRLFFTQMQKGDLENDESEYKDQPAAGG